MTPTDFGFLPVPTRLRYDPDKPFHFGLVLNIAFGFASTFTAANLYYCQPLLIEFSKSFDVNYEQVSQIPTLVQAGYASGLVLITPLGDLVRRRPLVLLLVLLSTTFTVGLSVTTNLRLFEALCFLTGLVTVTPQVLMPLAADLATPDRRGTALSVVLSGLMFGVLAARVLAGVIANFASWRIVYYMAISVQALVLVGAYFMPSQITPAKNINLSYFQILGSMAKYAVTEPLVVQASLINIASSACFSAFWVTLTFLLGGPPYYYSTVKVYKWIGSSSACLDSSGCLVVLVGPFAGRLIDKLVPWYATLIATLILSISQAVQTAAGGINVSAVIIACFGLDAARQMQQVSLSTDVFSISTTARARLNAILILSVPFYRPKLLGTSVGTVVFVQHGWRACALLLQAWQGFQLVILFLRGPHCPRKHWFARKMVQIETRPGGEPEEN
ncbi:major facilitator superfamily domain-containing protein [Pisolithus microcarpus]|nr:major facilitator superfamily domain-containing protein [Pisolithus microcarpus]